MPLSPHSQETQFVTKSSALVLWSVTSEQQSVTPAAPQQSRQPPLPSLLGAPASTQLLWASRQAEQMPASAALGSRRKAREPSGAMMRTCRPRAPYTCAAILARMHLHTCYIPCTNERGSSPLGPPALTSGTALVPAG